MEQKQFEPFTLETLKERIQKLMATSNQGFADLSNDLNALSTDMTAGFTAVLANITALQAQGTGVTNAQLEELAAQVTTMKSGFDSFVTSATAPAPAAPTTTAPASGSTAPASS